MATPAPRNRSRDNDPRAGAARGQATEPAMRDAQVQDLTRTALPAHTDEPAVAGADHEASGASQPLDAEARRSRIEFEAYMRYLQRGGAPGADLDDWLAAERQVDGQAD